MCQIVFCTKIKTMTEKNAYVPGLPAKAKENSVWELVKFATLALAIVIPIRTFIAQPFIVSGSSMVPTFLDGQYLIVEEITYKFGGPHRGDVVIFKYPKDTTKFFIKRIIGLPGEHIEIKGSVITITNDQHPNGFVLDEPFVKNVSFNDISKDIGTDEYWVMGDNRNASSDSRIWGTVPKNLLVGRAFARLLPIKNADVLPGDFKQL